MTEISHKTRRSYYQLDALVADVCEQRQQKAGLNDPALLLIGLAEEVGECCGAVKKHVRDGASLEPLTLELGDVLWYLIANLEYHNLTIDDIAGKCMAKLTARRAAKAVVKP